MSRRNDLIDELLKDYRSPEEILGKDGLIKQLTKAVLERALEAELEHHLTQERQAEVDDSGDSTESAVPAAARTTTRTLHIQCQAQPNETAHPSEPHQAVRLKTIQAWECPKNGRFPDT